ncbi:MAG TPA: DUF3800 domain-containing protein [bacterium]|jgi:hypothetical protein
MAGEKASHMILFYCDEAGNTGANIDDSSQPYHYVLALGVDEAKWTSIKTAYYALIKAVLPRIGVDSSNCPYPILPADFELHACEIWHRKGVHFRNLSMHDRVNLIQGAAEIIDRHKCEIVYGRCPKSKLAKYSSPAHPHWCAALICLERIARVCTRNNALAVVVADQNLEVQDMVKDVVSHYRHHGPPFGPAQNLQCITDNVHFMDSRGSEHMQLADVCTWLIARNERRANGIDPALAQAHKLVRQNVSDWRSFPY